MCRVFEVSRSGFYTWLKRLPSRKAQVDAKLAPIVKIMFEHNRRVYGCVRLSEALKRFGVPVGVRRTRRLMLSQSLRPVQYKPYVRTTDSSHNQPKSKDLVNRHFHAEKPDQLWTSDFTYIWTLEGFWYLVLILDVFSRYIVGWTFAAEQRAEQVIEAFLNACKQRNPPEGMVFHSDKGGQFCAESLRSVLEQRGVRSSMGSTGDCFDNAITESLNATIKKECIYALGPTSPEETRKRLFDYIEVFYNRNRLHSSLNYKSPMEYEQNAAV